MRFFKRFVRILVLVVLLGGIGLAAMVHLSHLTPQAYMPRLLTEAQRDEMSRRVDTQKIPRLLNLVEVSRNRERQVQQGKEVDPPTDEAGPLTLTFTEDEINASLWKWSEPYKVDYEHYVVDPYISLQDSSIVLMGKIPDLGIVSAYFDPKLTDKGLLDCGFGGLKLGSLPLPETLVSKKEAKLENALKTHISQWQEHAKIDPAGAANSDARAACLGKLVLNLLHHEPSPAVIFVRKDAKHSFPVRLTKVSVEKGSLSITFESMNPPQRLALLEKIREPGVRTVAELPKN